MVNVIELSKKYYIAIRTDDHGSPHVHIITPHVHIITPDGEAKVYIDNLEVERNNGISKHKLNAFKKVVEEYRNFLHEKWEEYHGTQGKKTDEEGKGKTRDRGKRNT